MGLSTWVTYILQYHHNDEESDPICSRSSQKTTESPRDKTNKMACAPSKDSDQPGHPPSLISLRCPHEESLGP